MHHFEVSGLAQRARSRGVAQVMDPRVDADIYPFALVGTDSVIGDRIALAPDEFLPVFGHGLVRCATNVKKCVS